MFLKEATKSFIDFKPADVWMASDSRFEVFYGLYTLKCVKNKDFNVALTFKIFSLIQNTQKAVSWWLWFKTDWFGLFSGSFKLLVIIIIKVSLYVGGKQLAERQTSAVHNKETNSQESFKNKTKVSMIRTFLM